tara:strand:+ start:884 stop:1165 length:282 start_codon:yes stop_codon:yes gene_type:complete
MINQPLDMTIQIFCLKNESLKEHSKQLKMHVYFKVLSRLRKQQVAITSFYSLCFCRLECDTLGGLFLQVTFLVQQRWIFSPLLTYVKSVVLYH